MHGILSYFTYWLNSNILSFSDGITIPQKSWFLHTWNTFYTFLLLHEIKVYFLFLKNEDNPNNKNHHDVLILFHLII